MNHIILPDEPFHGLPFYLAAEEFAAMDKNADEAFFVWSVPPTVIFGRNQNIFTEVNLDYCNAHGVDIVRRKSGGGCVYADKGNIMISYITGRGDVQDVFGRYLDRLVEALAGLGLHAVRSGRNDILVDGFKVSGNAFRMLPDRCVVHGTLLYDVDFGAMSKAISPSSGKLASNGVASVRARVANIKPYLAAAGHADMDVEALKAYLVDFCCDSHSEITAEGLREIEAVEKTYRDRIFLYDRHCKDVSLVYSGRIPSVGEVRIAFVPDENGKIAEVHLSGDYFLLEGMTPEAVDKAFTEVFAGCDADAEQISLRLGRTAPESMILNLTVDDLQYIINNHDNGRES